MRVARVLVFVAGVMVLLVSMGIGAGGGVLLWANGTQRDAAGYFSTPAEEFRSPGVALVSTVSFAMHPAANSWINIEPLGTVRVRASVPGASTFLGIAPSARVSRYLAGSSYSRVDSVSLLPFRAHYRESVGSVRPARPSSQGFWVASVSGVGTQQLTWHPTSGNWTLVLMRTDARAGLSAQVAVGTNTGLVAPLGVLLVIIALLAAGLGALLVVVGARGRRARAPASAPEPLGVSRWAPGAYPVRLEGRLEPGLSRWLWLIKWILVIPHLIVLGVLWLAVLVLTMGAAVAILVTGRYPRDIFAFVVGVMRWSWRVGFYASSAFGTDRYPPFSLAADASYPADFDVAYPEHLSRALVLVKWWLLAIPQYIIVGLFTGGGVTFTGHWPPQWWFVGGGAIGILVVASGVVLLFTGTYPAPLFDVVMGMDRWSARVACYALLLRDEYPPFRFDAGGADPASLAAAPEAPGPDPGSPGPHGA